VKDQVNVAVIGAGYWGKKVISEYLRLMRNSEAKLSKVCDLKVENLAYCRDHYGIADKDLTRDYREAVSSEDVDAVHICTPNETHYPIALEALKSGKHVLIEKPLTLYAKNAYDLVDLAKDMDLILQVGHIFRFNNALRLTRKLIRKRVLGEIYYVRERWTTLMPPPPGRDILFDLAPHPIDVLNYLIGKWPSVVTCRAKAYRENSFEEVAYITAEFDGRLMANIELSWLQPGKVRNTDLIASEFCASVDCLSQKVEIKSTNGEETKLLDVKKNNTLYDEIHHFINSILNNHNFRNSAAVVGVKNVEVLESLKKSLVEGRTVKVP